MDDERETLARGVSLFNERLFFEAHEAWEEIWLTAAEPLRRYLQGLIQLAAALHHLRRGNTRGGTRLLRNALRKLDDYPAGYAGIDAGEAIRCARGILASGEPRVDDYPTIRLT